MYDNLILIAIVAGPLILGFFFGKWFFEAIAWRARKDAKTSSVWAWAGSLTVGGIVAVFSFLALVFITYPDIH